MSSAKTALTFHREIMGDFRWLRRVRPAALQGLLGRLLLPMERRRILATDVGLRLYSDPVTILGRELASHGRFEPATEAVFRAEIRPGDAVVDIGANEGAFTALAGVLAGPEGQVVAVEPQSRLRDLIEINLLLNGVRRFTIFSNALGEASGTQAEMNLWPYMATGASSLAHRYRFSRQRETVSFIGFDEILDRCGIERAAFVKVDTEGFEDRVVESMLDCIRAGRVAKLFLDYHRPILEQRDVDADIVHRALLDAGLTVRSGDTVKLSGYVLYAHGSLPSEAA
jgi:FkbM family methyltransferase